MDEADRIADEVFATVRTRPINDEALDRFMAWAEKEEPHHQRSLRGTHALQGELERLAAAHRKKGRHPIIDPELEIVIVECPNCGGGRRLVPRGKYLTQICDFCGVFDDRRYR